MAENESIKSSIAMPDKAYTALCVSHIVAQQDIEDVARINELVHAMQGTL